MVKVLANFSVDEHVWDAFRKVVPTRERSAAIQNFMLSMVNLESPNREEADLIQEMEDRRRRLSEEHQSIASLSAQIEQIRAERSKRNKENLKKLKEHRDLVDRSGIKDKIGSLWG